MGDPDTLGQSETGLRPQDIQCRVLLTLPEALTTSLPRAEAGRPEIEIEPISDPATLSRLVGASLFRALQSRYGSHGFLTARRRVGHRIAIYSPWCAFPNSAQAAFWLNDHPRFSRAQFGTDLGISPEPLRFLKGSGRDAVRAWVSSLELVVFGRDGVLADVADLVEPSMRSARPAPVVQEGTLEPSYEDGAEKLAAEETTRKTDLFSWADRVLGFGDAELELELDEAAKRFGLARQTLIRIVKARGHERKKDEQARIGRDDDAPEDGVRYYGTDFKVSRRGVFARRCDSEGTPYWHVISTTPINIEALTRDARGENWGTYVVITDRDGGVKKLAIRHALTAADKAAEIAALFASLGAGVVPSKLARQLMVQFLTTEVKARITSLPQIGWHKGDGTWVFVLPDETLVPSGFEGTHPILQTASLQTQHGLNVAGSVEQWVDEIARPLNSNSNVQLCVGTAFAGPLLL
jgi:hypothetical protein